MAAQAERPGPSFDEQRAERFAERLTSALNEAALVVMTSLGHRSGLFDALSAEPPLGSTEIAATTGLQERYVREWLAAMVVARVIEYDAAARRYRLPPEHAVFLSRTASRNNLAVTAQFVQLLGPVEDAILDSSGTATGSPLPAIAAPSADRRRGPSGGEGHARQGLRPRGRRDQP